MPNWTESSIHISGDADVLKKIRETNFDFHSLYPSPFVTKETTNEGWYTWCCSHWGTKWPARDIEIDQDHSGLYVRLVTAWSTPHGVLAYLSHTYPSLSITNEWSDECNEVIGFTTYNGGTVLSKSFEPSCYTLKALHAFASSNTWFDYDAYENDYNSNMEYCEDRDAAENNLLDSVNVNMLNHTYEEFRNRMALMYP
jgi:hypothetical protein